MDYYIFVILIFFCYNPLRNLIYIIFGGFMSTFKYSDIVSSYGISSHEMSNDEYMAIWKMLSDDSKESPVVLEYTLKDKNVDGNNFNRIKKSVEKLGGQLKDITKTDNMKEQVIADKVNGIGKISNMPDDFYNDYDNDIMKEFPGKLTVGYMGGHNKDSFMNMVKYSGAYIILDLRSKNFNIESARLDKMFDTANLFDLLKSEDHEYSLIDPPYSLNVYYGPNSTQGSPQSTWDKGANQVKTMLKNNLDVMLLLPYKTMYLNPAFSKIADTFPYADVISDYTFGAGKRYMKQNIVDLKNIYIKSAHDLKEDVLNGVSNSKDRRLERDAFEKKYANVLDNDLVYLISKDKNYKDVFSKYVFTNIMNIDKSKRVNNRPSFEDRYVNSIHLSNKVLSTLHGIPQYDAEVLTRIGLSGDVLKYPIFIGGYADYDKSAFLPGLKGQSRYFEVGNLNVPKSSMNGDDIFTYSTASGEYLVSDLARYDTLHVDKNYVNDIRRNTESFLDDNANVNVDVFEHIVETFKNDRINDLNVVSAENFKDFINHNSVIIDKIAADVVIESGIVSGRVDMDVKNLLDVYFDADINNPDYHKAEKLINTTKSDLVLPVLKRICNMSEQGQDIDSKFFNKISEMEISKVTKDDMINGMVETAIAGPALGTDVADYEVKMNVLLKESDNNIIEPNKFKNEFVNYFEDRFGFDKSNVAVVDEKGLNNILSNMIPQEKINEIVGKALSDDKLVVSVIENYLEPRGINELKNSLTNEMMDKVRKSDVFIDALNNFTIENVSNDKYIINYNDPVSNLIPAESVVKNEDDKVKLYVDVYLNNAIEAEANKYGISDLDKNGYVDKKVNYYDNDLGVTDSMNDDIDNGFDISDNYNKNHSIDTRIVDKFSSDSTLLFNNDKYDIFLDTVKSYISEDKFNILDGYKQYVDLNNLNYNGSTFGQYLKDEVKINDKDIKREFGDSFVVYPDFGKNIESISHKIVPDNDYSKFFGEYNSAVISKDNDIKNDVVSNLNQYIYDISKQNLIDMMGYETDFKTSLSSDDVVKSLSRVGGLKDLPGKLENIMEPVVSNYIDNKVDNSFRKEMSKVENAVETKQNLVENVNSKKIGLS